MHFLVIIFTVYNASFFVICQHLHDHTNDCLILCNCVTRAVCVASKFKAEVSISRKQNVVPFTISTKMIQTIITNVIGFNSL